MCGSHISGYIELSLSEVCRPGEIPNGAPEFALFNLPKVVIVSNGRCAVLLFSASVQAVITGFQSDFGSKLPCPRKESRLLSLVSEKIPRSNIVAPSAVSQPTSQRLRTKTPHHFLAHLTSLAYGEIRDFLFSWSTMAYKVYLETSCGV
ncbi:hypothetical protein E4T56_gene10904 [Termitomyces sp. T112]|nr:hypothetical protein E4T56_gene10904 [Termitomyces sp. T112]